MKYSYTKNKENSHTYLFLLTGHFTLAKTKNRIIK